MPLRGHADRDGIAGDAARPRLVIPGDIPSGAMASGRRLVATAGDVARYFAQLVASPNTTA